MEFRAFLQIPGLPFEDEGRWEPFINRLESNYRELGPVVGWSEQGAEVVVSIRSASEADATRRAVDAVTDCLRSTGLGELYPGSVEVERVSDEELASA
jgi:hypothetical protein